MNPRCFIVAFLLMADCDMHPVMAQSVEAYGGNRRTGVDIMWFRYFKNEKGQRSSILYFSRNRAGSGYDTPMVALASTNAVSYNFKNGIGLVAVASFTNAGFTPKAGLQFHRQKGDFMFFGWLVADLRRRGGLDLFGMVRFTPPVSSKASMFTQMELFPAWKPSHGTWNITERLRLGGKWGPWAAGWMYDLNHANKDKWSTTGNMGLFIRHDF